MIHLGAIADRTAVLQLWETSYNRRYIALVRRAKSLWALGRFEEADGDIETILSTTDIAVEQKMAARLLRAEWAADMGIPAIVETELGHVLASRRNFPKVTEVAVALARDFDMLDGLAVNTTASGKDGSKPGSIARVRAEGLAARGRSPRCSNGGLEGLTARVARLWTANLAETAPRPARDRPTGRPTV